MWWGIAQGKERKIGLNARLEMGERGKHLNVWFGKHGGRKQKAKDRRINCFGRKKMSRVGE